MITRTGWLARLFRNRQAKTAPSVVPDRPTPLSVQRIGDYLTGRGYHFRVDDDGDITGTWEGHRFWFLLLGEKQEILQVRGCWSDPIHAASRLDALQVDNDWNRERIWPKVYLRADRSGPTLLYAEISVDFEYGATDIQLGQIIACGLGTAVQLFRAIGMQLRFASET
jgi:hypothetical protein